MNDVLIHKNKFPSYHDFMQEVAEKGCRLFVVEKEIPEEQLQKLQAKS